MATLTEIGYYTRQTVKWGAVFLLVVMITPFVYRGVLRAYGIFNPTPPPPPTVKYGKLPKLDFPTKGLEAQITYRLETIEGTLPKLPDVARVYVVGINKSRLLELERAKAKAAELKMEGEPVKLDDVTYRFTNIKTGATLTFNLLSGGFDYKYDFLNDPSAFVPISLPTLEKAGEAAKDWLSGLGALPPDLASGNAKSLYLMASQSGEMVAAPSYSEANFVRTDIFRSDIDKTRIVTPDGETSPVNVLFSGVSDKSRKVVDAHYHYSMRIGDGFETYPLKTVDQAWSELTQGLGYVTKVYPTVTIRKVSLAIYESGTAQQFLQPVYVFEGDGKFSGYVQAVGNQFIQESM